MLTMIPPSVPCLNVDSTFSEFYLNFLSSNLPCLFEEKYTSNWPARKKWFNESIDIDEIMAPFTGRIVCVANCGEFEFGTHTVFKMSAQDYLAYWKSQKKDRSLYLKDWHYFSGKDFTNFYTLPVHFTSDWLNEFCDLCSDCGAGSDDFRFVYIGPKGTWTPLHADVYCSYSWSANIAGLKRWWLFPPGEEKKVAELNGGQLPSDISALEFAKPGSVDTRLPQCYIFDQQPGEMFFVPSGWFHQVLNLTDCVSINNNWLNACNVSLVWKHLCSQLKAVKASCADVESTPGWDQACQDCLKAWEGWNYAEFFLLLKYILLSRWLDVSRQETCSRLPAAATATSSRESSMRVLDEQIESLLSSTAQSDPALVQWLTSSMDKTINTWKSLPESDSVRVVRQHDLEAARETIQSLVMDEDLQNLGLHSSGPAAWLWKKIIDAPTTDAQ